MQIAHFSDFHIGISDAARDCERAVALVARALEAGAEHLVFSGDLVDRGNVEDLIPLVRYLKSRRMLAPDRLTVVPGNHDIWPFGEGAAAGDIIRSLRGNLESLGSFDADLPAQKRFERFVELFGPTFAGVRSRGRHPFPCLKQVGDVTFALLDTTADTALRHAQGQLDDDDARWVLRQLSSREGPSVLVMHHWPFEWSVVDPDDVAEQVPGWLRSGLKWAGLDADDLASDLVDVNFRDLAAVQRFVKRGAFDAVLCGHLHGGDDGPEDPDFDRKLGAVPVWCMGRSGAVHQDSPRKHAFHLIDVGGAARASVKTVFVARKALARG